MSTTPPPSPATGLPAQYRPAEHEARVRAAWEGSGAFHADPGRVLRGEAEPFCILIPPPNVTAALHLGHAFNNTLQDVLVRAHRMMGFETLWMPGTDHAGIATQAVVERRLREEGVLTGPLRDAMSREEFVGRAQAWKDEYEARILEQLKAMGCSCDWARTRFTMDEVCARAVREAFFRLFKAGLIYRGKRLVNWDPVLQTAVADDELEDREVDGKFYYLRYPLVERVGATERRSDAATKGEDASLPLAKRADWRPVEWSELAARGYPGAEAFPEDQPAWVTVATTRPETYLGDTAVAVNPKDPRAVALRGLMVELPLVGRVIPIVEDDYVVMPDPEGEDPKAKFATGFLKVTPAHDENDYALYQRHKPVMDAACGGEGRALINIMAPDASISDKHGWGDADEVKNAHVFVGRSREEARDLVIREFQAHEIGTETLLERIRPYTHTVPYSDRSKVPIEPWLSDQWYVKVTDDRLRGEAQRALAAEQRTSGTFPPRTGEDGDGGMRFHPDRYAKSYESWHDNLRDWCVSRQLWWGHRVPVWHKRVRLTTNEGDRNDTWHESLDFIIDGGHPAQAWYTEGTAPDDGGRRRVASVRVVRARDGAEFVPSDWDQDSMPQTPDPGLGWLDDAPGTEFDIFVCTGPDCDHLERQLAQHGYRQDPDVLDTWFSSASWPISTMGWPEPEQSEQTRGLLAAFNPSTVLCTGRDIITLWVSRMVMFNRFLLAGTPALRAGSPTTPSGPRTSGSWLPALVSVCHRSDAFNAPHFEPLHPERFVGRDPYPKGSPSPSDLIRTQRRLPHVELADATYFVTWNTVDGERLDNAERAIVHGAFEHWHDRGCEVFALSIMGTHVHALVRLAAGTRLGEWCESIKRFSATQINKRRGEKGSIWHADRFDHVVRNGGDLAEFVHYIVNNASAAGVVEKSTEDRFAWVSEEVAVLIEGGRGELPKPVSGGSVEGVGDPARRAGVPSGPPPFRDVYINPIIQDGHGQRMSKSLGNGVDPLDIVHSHGADAMRFVLTQIATSTQDVRMPVDLVCPHTGKTFEPKFVTSPQGYLVAAPFQESPGDPSKKMVSPYGAASGAARPSEATPLARNTSSKFDIGRNFCNKLWNASRFALGILEKAGAVGGSGATDTGCKPVPPATLSLVDRWMLSRVRATAEAVAQSIRSYHFSSYAQAMYDLMWRDFCDWYLEAIKPTVAQSREQQAVLAHTLESIVRLLHPLVPFITEAIWEHLREVETAPIAGVTLKASRVDGLLATAGWPELGESLRDEKAEADFGRMQALAGAIREVRAKHQVPPKRRIALHASAALAKDIAAAGGIIEALCTLSRVETGPPSGDAAAVAVAFTFEAGEYQLSELADAVDLGAERERLEKQIADLKKSIAALDGRLSNPGYVDRAPAHLVQQTRDERTRKDADLNAAIAALGRLG